MGKREDKIVNDFLEARETLVSAVAALKNYLISDDLLAILVATIKVAKEARNHERDSGSGDAILLAEQVKRLKKAKKAAKRKKLFEDKGPTPEEAVKGKKKSNGDGGR